MSTRGSKPAPGSQIVFHTTFNATTWNGLAADVVKSALQKYLRRRVWDKMAWAAIELYLFIEVGAEAALTNLATRLGVMASEELLFADVDRFLQIHRRLAAWDREDLTVILEVCRLLIDGRLLRLASDINTAYHTAPQYGLGLDLWDPQRAVADVSEWAQPGDQKHILEDLGRFVTCLEGALDECFHWAFQITSAQTIGARRYRRTGAEYILWDVLYSYAPNEKAKEVLDVQLSWYFDQKRKERPIFLINAILMIIHQHTIDWETEVEPNVTAEEVQRRLDDVVAGRIPTIDDYVVDMHTKAGRRSGKSRNTFASEGALVVDEDKTYYDPRYRELYQKVKELQGDGKERKGPAEAKGDTKGPAPPPPRATETKGCPAPARVEVKGADVAPTGGIPDELILYFPDEGRRESEVFEFQVRAQLVCSASRTDSYFARKRDTDEFVFVKGPFKSVPDAILSMRLRQAVGLPAPNQYLAYLVPDLLVTPLGLRKSLPKGQTYPFLVAEALCGPDLPTRMHESKCWPPTEVVDWDRVTTCTAFRPVDHPHALGAYAENLMYRYLVGTGDLADRNFLQVGPELYSIDEDTFGHCVDLEKELKKNKYQLMVAWFTKHKKELGARLDAWLSNTEFRRLLQESSWWDFVQERAQDFRRRYLA